MIEVIPVLILTYNRPEFLRDRLSELVYRDKYPYIVVSIDFDSDEMMSKNIKIIDEFKFRKTKLECIPREINLGIARHLPTAVDDVLHNHNFVIVIEDDIKIGPNTVQMLANSSEIFNKREDVFTIGGFSWTAWLAQGIRPNRWRVTRYFSAWGWITSRKQWANYQQDLRNEKIEELFKIHNPDINLNSGQKRLWLKRFEKCQNMPNRTWDIPMQYWTFKLKKVHLLPTQRILENVGFNSNLSTNTKSNRPKWMGDARLSDRLIAKIVENRLITWSYQFIDSFTIADDQPLKHKFMNFLTRGEK
jgi:hypothetical protein